MFACLLMLAIHVPLVTGGDVIGDPRIQVMVMATTPAGPRNQASYQTIEKGFQSGVREPLQIAVRSQAEWTELWTRHTANKQKPPAPPKVNFGQEMVVAVFFGEKPTGGYVIDITRAAKTDRGIEVGYREQSPARGTMTIQTLTQPFHIVRIPKSDGDEVTFRRLP